MTKTVASKKGARSDKQARSSKNKELDDDGPLVARNIRKIQKQAKVPRAAKGVGAAILEYITKPKLKLWLRQAIEECQKEKRKTVKEAHGEKSYEMLFDMKSPCWLRHDTCLAIAA